MESQQLRELSTNARLNHWPPHLGVTTDAEKIEYLAQRLEEVVDMEDRVAELSSEVSAMREKLDDLERDFESRIEELRDELDKMDEEDA